MVILKFIICASIVVITSYIGILKAGKLRTREQTLREAITFFSLVENEIKYMVSILPNAYEIARQKLSTDLKVAIGNIVVDMISLEDINLIHQSIVENISRVYSLADYDKNIIISTLKNLGRSDLEGQINIIENSINILENQVKEANEVKLVNSKLYRTMGVIAGLMIVVIVI